MLARSQRFWSWAKNVSHTADHVKGGGGDKVDDVIAWCCAVVCRLLHVVFHLVELTSVIEKSF